MAEEDVQPNATVNQPGDQDKDKFIPEKTPEDYADMWRNASAEAKRYRQQLAELKQEREDNERKRMEEQGMYKEMYSQEKAKNEKFEAAAKRGSRLSALRDELDKLGCPAKFRQLLVDQANIEGIDLDDSYRPNMEQVTFEVQRLQKAYPELFKKSVAAPRDGQPSDKIITPPKKKPADMTQAELEKYLRENF